LNVAEGPLTDLPVRATERRDIVACCTSCGSVRLDLIRAKGHEGSFGTG
jgi:hypothetical protein